MQFVPVKFDFESASDETRFYIYSICNTEKGKFYIGISRHPDKRINQQLKTKRELCEDYAKAAIKDQIVPPELRLFHFGLVNEKGYPNAFLGCIAEVLYMLRLEQQNIHIYNQNKFGGHPELREMRHAFDAIVRIIDPSIIGNPSDEDIANITPHITEIMNYIIETQNKDIINLDFLKRLNETIADHVKRKTLPENETIRPKLPPYAEILLNYTPLRIAVNDNSPEQISADIDLQNDYNPDHDYAP